MTKRLFLTVFFLIAIVFYAFAGKGFSVSEETFIPYSQNFEFFSQEEKMLSLINILTSISTQEGLTYYSKLDGKETVLFEESYLISDSTDSSSKISDPVFTTVPSKLRLYSFQKDNRFGSNIYELNYSVSKDKIELDITNKTKMKYMGITLIGPGKLEMEIDVSLLEDGFMVVASASSESIKLFAEDSFLRRVSSLSNWLKIKVSEVK